MGGSWGKDQWLKRVPEEWSTFLVENAMADDEKRPARPSAVRDPAAAGPTLGSGRPFDLWLQKQLHAMYDEIASEPLPPDLLNLIDQDAKDGHPDPVDGSPKKARG